MNGAATITTTATTTIRRSETLKARHSVNAGRRAVARGGTALNSAAAPRGARSRQVFITLIMGFVWR